MGTAEFAKLYTPEGEKLSGTPWNVYPRPLMERDSFLNLNGKWDFCVQKDSAMPESFDREILVPFAPESLLSGIHETVDEGTYLFYRRTFSLPEGFLKHRVLLHFGAVDQVADVWLNGEHIGSHTGGYEGFSFDITDALKVENTLVVRAVDNMSRCILPYGKQRKKRGGMWYTPVSGIWQTVWMESVTEGAITAVHISANGKEAAITVEGGVIDGTVTYDTPQGRFAVPLVGGRAVIRPECVRNWSPEDPYLYHFTIETICDRVRSYFALRMLDIRVIGGKARLCLNGKPRFFHGLLDQGYWSDGLLTPAGPECFERDIREMKALGFNTLRKHIKVEPQLFYAACDRLGMIVFQDMVNNGRYSFLMDTALPTIGLKSKNDKYAHPNRAARKAFLEGLESTVRQLRNHACICYCTIFNEGWGQFDSTAAYRKLKLLDSSRFIATVSGWFRGGETDVATDHCYFKTFRLRETEEPYVLSEFGGYAMKLPDHAFNPHKTYGYRIYNDQAALEKAVCDLYEKEIIPAVSKGLCGCVYTQVSDVEDETNGLVTYDRRVTKVSAEAMNAIAVRLQEEMDKAK